MYLDRMSFIYGNIKPDLEKELREKSHRYEDTIHYVMEKIQNLTDLELSKNEFSKELGVICHFISDFFCTYHKKKYEKENIFKHLLYETKLHIYLKNKIKKRETFLFEKKDNEIIYDLRKMVIKMHEEYMSKEHTKDNDIIFALNCAMMISSKLEYDYRQKAEQSYWEYVYA